MKFFTVFILFLFYSQLSTGQSDSVESKVFLFGGSISANTNGFSLVPTFSLGKPALQTGLNFGAKNSRFSAHPQFWYSVLDYKPWSFIFIWRYKIVERENFSFAAGTHTPGINFKSATVVEDNTQNSIIKARRFYPALELIPTYKISKNTSLGLYYILGSGIEKEIATINNFISVRADFNNLRLSEDLFMRFNPQLYFLSIDQTTGFYASWIITLGSKKLPFTIASNFNKALKSSINAKDFDWNVGINYEFASQFVKKK